MTQPPVLLPRCGGALIALIVLGLGLVPHQGIAALVINEFLPDPQGADAGREFVELINSGPLEFDLQGVSLEFANGIEGPVWNSRWVCQEATVLSPGQRYLLVDRNWLGDSPGQAEVWLGLQNGPDAIRLVQGELVLDMVGYGPLTDVLMMEGSPVPLTPGLALARRPDGTDSDNNSMDFVSHTPTPGLPNFLTLALELQTVVFDPPAADRSGVRVGVSAVLRNAGTEELPTGPIVLHCFGKEHQAVLDACQPDEIRSVTWFLMTDLPGRWPVHLERLLEAGGDTMMVPLGDYQVGAAGLYLNEVLGAPAAGQGEWLELACQGPGPIQLGEFRIRDEEGSWLSLPDCLLLPGDLAVVAQDSSKLAAWQLANQTAGLVDDCSGQNLVSNLFSLPGSWPTLNNSAPEGRDFADRVYLGDALGTVLDQVTLGGPGSEDALDSGHSWERVAVQPIHPTEENWAPCTSLATGTPGCANSVALPAGAPTVLSVAPSFLDPEGGYPVLHLRFLVEQPSAGWWLRVFNTWGELVRDLGGDLLGPGPRDLLWDGRDDLGQAVPQGAYIVQLQLRSLSGEILERATATSAVRRRVRP